MIEVKQGTVHKSFQMTNDFRRIIIAIVLTSWH